MIKKITLLIAGLFVLLAKSAQPSTHPLSSFSADRPLRLAVAANFKPTLIKLIEAFEADLKSRQLAQLKIDITAASTGVLYAQIVQGAPFDIFFSADTKTVDRLFQSRQILGDFQSQYAKGRLVLWSRSQVDYLTARTRLCDHRLVMANPKVAPYGRAAQTFLKQVAGSAAEVCEPDIVFANNVVHGVQIAHLGYVDYALLPLSLLKNHPLEGHYWPILVDELSLSQSMAVLTSTRNEKAAIHFFQFMQSEMAQSLIEKEGYYRIN